MARASTPTLLSLSRFAAIMAVSPVHFSGARGQDVWLDYGSCDDIWPQYAWQIDSEIVSREEVAFAIASAERDIAQVLGYWPAPVWIENEMVYWPRNGSNIVNAEWGNILAPGKRGAVSILDAAAVVYSDPDGDGWQELATITVPTTFTDRREIKLFTAGKGGQAPWEIRPLLDVVITAGIAVITANSWSLIKPELWEVKPSTSGFAAIDITNTANFVTEVDVWRIFNDSTQAGARFIGGAYSYNSGGFYWSCSSCQGAGCEVCGVTVSDGCFTIANHHHSMLIPFPASYVDGAWANTVLSGPPSTVSLNYYAGETSQEYRAGGSLDPLSDYLAEAIAWIAVARLGKGACGCGRIKSRFDALQRDMAQFRAEANGPLYSHFAAEQTFNNPIGRRAGEVQAWERVALLIGDQVWGAGVL